MRKPIFFGFLILSLIPVLTEAQVSDSLRTVNSILITNGKVVETGVLADSSSEVFIELTKNSFVGSELDQKEFNGELLAPQLTGAITKAPRARMREILSFDFFTDRADTAIFVDRYAMMHERTRLREQILTGTDFARSSGAQVLVRLYRDENIGKAALWQYDNIEETWHRVGGVTGSSSEPDVDVFSAIIFETGSYTLWDEDPAPEFSPLTDPAAVELAEISPFPSVNQVETVNFESVPDFETPFTEDDQTLFDQPVPATEPRFAPAEPIGLIPAVGLPQPEETTPAQPEDTTPPNEFSESFLEGIDGARSSALINSDTIDTSAIEAPAGATLPSTGTTENNINWINYLVALLLLGVIGGSIWVVRKKPY